MANIFFISDTHFGHANILKFTWQQQPCRMAQLRQPCDEKCAAMHPQVPIRPGFASVEEMDEFMIEKWNSVVRESDHIYHLGDVVMNPKQLPIVKRLKGKKRLLLGNHDHAPVKMYLEVGFGKVFGSRLIENMLLTHIPVHPSNLGRFPVNLHGHIHQNPAPYGPYINLSVEVIDYTPVALEDIRQRVKKLPTVHNAVNVP